MWFEPLRGVVSQQAIGSYIYHPIQSVEQSLSNSLLRLDKTRTCTTNNINKSCKGVNQWRKMKFVDILKNKFWYYLQKCLYQFVSVVIWKFHGLFILSRLSSYNWYVNGSMVQYMLVGIRWGRGPCLLFEVDKLGWFFGWNRKKRDSVSRSYNTLNSPVSRSY